MSLISAREAREMIERKQREKSTAQLENVMAAIDKAIAASQFTCYVDGELDFSVTSALRSRGYRVTPDMDETIISW